MTTHKAFRATFHTRFLKGVLSLSMLPMLSMPSMLSMPETAAAEYDEFRSMRAQLSKETRAYEKYLAEHPGDKNVSRVLMALAKHQILRANLTPDAKEADALLVAARERIADARKLLEADLAVAEARRKSFPAYVDPDQDPQTFSERQVAESTCMSIRLQLAMTRWVDAHTHPEDSNQRRDKLVATAETFSKLHRMYRSHVSGLYARLWEGRCLQELGKNTVALGVFRELISLSDRQPQLRTIGNQALHFSLMALNAQNKSLDVISEGSEWFENASPAEQATDTSAGILWELACAMWRDQQHEQTGDVRVGADSLSKRPVFASRDRILWFALRLFRHIQHADGTHRSAAEAWEQRVQALLGK